MKKLYKVPFTLLFILSIVLIFTVSITLLITYAETPIVGNNGWYSNGTSVVTSPNTLKVGIGAIPSHYFHVEKSIANNYVAYIKNATGPGLSITPGNDLGLVITDGLTNNVLLYGSGKAAFANRVAVGYTPIVFNNNDMLVVNGPIRITDMGTKPSCVAAFRGMIWHDFGGTGVKDTVEICAKDATNTYAWRVIY